MKYLAISLMILSVSLFSCGSTEDAEPTPDPEVQAKEFFTVTVDPAYNFIGSLDNWVIATNMTGTLLDAKPFVAGDVVKLESTEVVDKFTLHFLRVDKMASNAPYFNLISYNEIAAKGSWKLINPNVPPPVDDELIGNLKISLVNYPVQPDIATFDNIKVSGVRGNMINSMTSDGSTVDIGVTMSKSTTELIVSFFKNQRSYYKKLSGPFDGGVITLDAQLDFETVVRDMMFNYEETKYVWIGFYAFKTGENHSYDGYILSERKYTGGDVFGFFGSIDGYDKYRTIVVLSKDNYTRTFYKFGEQTLGIPYFQTPFTAMYKTGITDFSCQVGAPNSRTSIYFHNPMTKDLAWEVVSPKSNVIPELNFAFKELPQDLVSKYPSLNLSQIVFKNGSAIQYMDNFTYQDFLAYKANVKESTKINSNEYYVYDWE